MRRLLVWRGREEDEAGYTLSRLGEALAGQGWEVEERRLPAEGLLGIRPAPGEGGDPLPLPTEPALLLLDARLLGLLFDSPALSRSVALLSPPLFETASPSPFRAARHYLLGHLLPRLGFSLAPTRAVQEEARARFELPPARLLFLPPGVAAPAAAPASAAHPPRLLIPLLAQNTDALATPFAALARLFDLRFHTVIALPAEDPAMRAAIAARAAAHRLPPPEIVTGLGESALEADLLLLPEDEGALGVAAAWAAASGLPVALGAQAMGREFIAEGAAAFFAPGDAVQLSRALRRMIADAELRQSMREAAAKQAAWPDWTARAARLASALAALTALMQSMEE
jgi:hypothetical protein